MSPEGFEPSTASLEGDVINLRIKKPEKKRKIPTAHRKMNRQLLSYVKRNVQSIDELLKHLNGQVVFHKKDAKLLKDIHKIYEQQKYMYDDKVKSESDRIVNLHQPHVRPIPRSKQKSQVEFGSKLGVSLDRGFASVNTLS